VLKLAAHNTPEEIARRKKEKEPMASYCEKCGLMAMMTQEQQIEHVKTCK
jgi:transposase